jgi:hypothetical protein
MSDKVVVLNGKRHVFLIDAGAVGRIVGAYGLLRASICAVKTARRQRRGCARGEASASQDQRQCKVWPCIVVLKSEHIR